MESTTSIILSFPVFCGLVVGLIAFGGLIGFLLADRRPPRRFILVEDSGAWTIAKLHSIDNRADDAPISGLGQCPQQSSLAAESADGSRPSFPTP
jgi:hypothetical protein